MTRISSEERDKACQIGRSVARQRGYTITGQSMIGRQPTSQCDIVVIIAPAGAAWVHVVLEIIYKEDKRFLHTQDVHVGSEDADDCSVCDEYHTYELYYEYTEEDLEEHQCEGGMYWNDDGKGGFDQCTRYDTEWYESGFLLTGTAGWFCPTHRAQAYQEDLQEDLAIVRHARERAERRLVNGTRVRVHRSSNGPRVMSRIPTLFGP